MIVSVAEISFLFEVLEKHLLDLKIQNVSSASEHQYVKYAKIVSLEQIHERFGLDDLLDLEADHLLKAHSDFESSKMRQ